MNIMCKSERPHIHGYFGVDSPFKICQFYAHCKQACCKYVFIIVTLPTGRVDYPPEPDTQLRFSPTVNRVCINVSVFDDTETEDTEAFEVSLSADSTDIVFQPGTTLVVILDDDDQLQGDFMW